MLLISWVHIIGLVSGAEAECVRPSVFEGTLVIVDGDIHRSVIEKPLPKQGLLLKAGEAIRTPDIHVGNVTLYH